MASNDAAESGTQVPHEIWGGGERDLEYELEEYYGIDGLWVSGDYHHEERGEVLYDVLLYFDGDDRHYIDHDLEMLGHGPSGAVGVVTESLPSPEKVQEVVEEVGAK